MKAIIHVSCGQWQPSPALVAGDGSYCSYQLRWLSHRSCCLRAMASFAHIGCGRWLPLPTLVSDKKEIKGSQSGHWALFTWTLSLPFSWAMVSIAGKQHGLWKPDNASDGFHYWQPKWEMSPIARNQYHCPQLANTTNGFHCLQPMRVMTSFARKKPNSFKDNLVQNGYKWLL